MIEKNIDKKTIVILFSGAGSNLDAIVKNLHNQDVLVLAAITNNPDAKGIKIAQDHGIAVEIVDSKRHKKREEFDRILVDKIKSYNPDLVVLAGFMRILTPIFTEQIRAINLHPSLLPRHKGLNAIKKSFDDEYSNGGVTVHWVSSCLDGGEIILQESVEKKGLSFDEYYNKIREVEKAVLINSIKKVFGGLNE